MTMDPTLLPAASRAPFAEETMRCRSATGAALVNQLNPAFVDRKTRELLGTAASFWPSADEATLSQVLEKLVMK